MVKWDGTAALANFGDAFITADASQTKPGSEAQRPPEMLNWSDKDANSAPSAEEGVDGDPLAVSLYSKKSDVYSLGMAFLEVCPSVHPKSYHENMLRLILIRLSINRSVLASVRFLGDALIVRS